MEVGEDLHFKQQRQLEGIEVLQKVREVSAYYVRYRPWEVEMSFFQELQEISKED